MGGAKGRHTTHVAKARAEGQKFDRHVMDRRRKGGVRAEWGEGRRGRGRWEGEGRGRGRAPDAWHNNRSLLHIIYAPQG